MMHVLRTLRHSTPTAWQRAGATHCPTRDDTADLGAADEGKRSRSCWLMKRAHQPLSAFQSAMFISCASSSALAKISFLLVRRAPIPTAAYKHCSSSGCCTLLQRLASRRTPEIASARIFAMLSGLSSLQMVMRDLLNSCAISSCRMYGARSV